MSFNFLINKSMLLRYNQFTHTCKALEEKLIVIGKGKKYGQIVFLAGGAGSGKAFAISNFINSFDFKVRDVDAWKKAFLELNRVKNKYPELNNLELSNPEDVSKLHEFVKDLGIKNKTLDLILNNAKNKEILPNIIFDITLKDVSDMTKYLPDLINVGYDPKNIHLVWVLTNINVALERNSKRERRVDPKMVLKTHTGATASLSKIAKALPRNFDGAIHVILNNQEETVFYTDSEGKPIKNLGQFPKEDKKTGKMIYNMIVKDFTYLTVKEQGRPIKSDSKIIETLNKWADRNIPKDVLDRTIL